MMWLPRPLYEAVPYLYLGVGAALLGVAFFAEGGPSGLLFGLGAVSLVAGLVLWMRRRDYRASQAEYDAHVFDDGTGQFRRLPATSTSSDSSESSTSSASSEDGSVSSSGSPDSSASSAEPGR